MDLHIEGENLIIGQQVIECEYKTLPNQAPQAQAQLDTLSLNEDYMNMKSPVSASEMYAQTIEQQNRENQLKMQMLEFERKKAELERKQQALKMEEDNKLLKDGLMRLQKRLSKVEKESEIRLQSSNILGDLQEEYDVNSTQNSPEVPAQVHGPEQYNEGEDDTGSSSSKGGQYTSLQRKLKVL